MARKIQRHPLSISVRSKCLDGVRRERFQQPKICRCAALPECLAAGLASTAPCRRWHQSAWQLGLPVQRRAAGGSMCRCLPIGVQPSDSVEMLTCTPATAVTPQQRACHEPSSDQGGGRCSAHPRRSPSGVGWLGGGQLRAGAIQSSRVTDPPAPASTSLCTPRPPCVGVTKWLASQQST
jgi:hypothetical protein